MLFFKVQSNRVKIKQLLDIFNTQNVKGEKIIAPRPKAKTVVEHYCAFVAVTEGSQCCNIIQKIKNCATLSENDFASEIKNISHSWSAGDIS